VRWLQHLLAIIAEVLILLSFAMSGMDVSLGGVMASVPWLKVPWAAMFALAIDTAFALSWVRVRQHFVGRRWLAFVGNLVLAFSISFIIFEPISVQLLQQSLDLSFSQAVANLGINIVFLTYARSGVAVFLGAILAVTNTADEATSVKSVVIRRHRFVWFKRLWQRLRTIGQRQPALPIPVAVEKEQSALQVEAPSELSTTTEQITSHTPAVITPAQPELPRYGTPEQRAARVSEVDLTDLSTHERIAKVLEFFPELSDRELGKLSGMSAATAKKYREALKAQAAKEDGQ
jgi:hypothetical protein